MTIKIKEFPVYCAWCKAHMSGPKGDFENASHGMCPTCLKQFKKEYEEYIKSKPHIKESKETMTFQQFILEKLQKIG